MTQRRVELHPGADEDLVHAATIYATADAEIARRFLAEVLRVKQDIAKHADRWPEHVESTRRVRMRKFPFLVIYREIDDLVQIIAVAHTSRRPGYWLDRLEDREIRSFGLRAELGGTGPGTAPG